MGSGTTLIDTTYFLQGTEVGKPDIAAFCGKLSVERENCSLSVSNLHATEFIADEPRPPKNPSDDERDKVPEFEGTEQIEHDRENRPTRSGIRQ